MSERPMSWADLPPHWRSSVELAWAAYGAGTTPVGAIVVDGENREVSRGANARYATGEARLPLPVHAAADGRHPGEFFDQLAGQNTGPAAGLR
jgi:hypothetical protein